MTRSEFEAKRLKFWGVRSDAVGWVLEWVERDCAAAEAAGVAWDPEEAPLPERVSIDSCGEVCLGRTPIHVLRGRSWEKWLAEAVRRYNAWPELWAFRCRSSFVGTSGEQLEKILRGEK